MLEAIKDIFLQGEYDFWSAPSTIAPTDVLVSPSQQEGFKSILNLLGLPYQVMIGELGG